MVIHEDVKTEFLNYYKEAVERFFPGGNYSKIVSIVNEKPYDRLMGLIKDEKVFMGGKGNPGLRIILPTVLEDITWDSTVMQEEIFGPILPVMTYKNLDEIIAQIKARAKPLALYLFTNDKHVRDSVLTKVSFGGGCINDTLVHMVSSTMGFGGVGDSGMGNYHGYRSFKTFSHEKSVLLRGNWMDPDARYRPYTANKYKFLKMLIG